MNGISGKGKDRINAIIEDMFDTLAIQLVGNIPALDKAKRLYISHENNLGLANLFVQAMSNKKPNELESDFLRTLLDSAHGFIEGLKNRTRASITERLDGIAREAKLKKVPVSKEQIVAALDEELKKAKSAMIAITESESTKLRNLGTMTDISRKAAEIIDDDPTVYFVVIKDKSTCKECVRLHLMADQSTPRLWKLSELKQGYHKRGENSPSVFGLHPHCRCTLTYLSRGFAFNEKGRLKFHDLGHDEYRHQRSKIA